MDWDLLEREMRDSWGDTLGWGASLAIVAAFVLLLIATGVALGMFL